ncbi:MAG: sigma-70 family RNA polymerase sigma factor [Thermoanaerobaculia bacterium]|nr:sigma-70 family RNA polymerase sigma factor [Thermoanaerobaculia bacterium]
MDEAREAPVLECWLDGPACAAYRPRLLRFYRKLHAPDSEQEDLTHSVLTKVLPKERAFPSEKARDTYVFKAAHNVWKDWLGKEKKSGAVSLDEISTAEAEGAARLPEALVEEATAFEGAWSEEKAELLRTAMESLPPKMRRCVWLFYVEQRPQRDIAQLLRIDVNTVKSHLGQARQLLGKRLGGKFGIIPPA